MNTNKHTGTPKEVQALLGDGLKGRWWHSPTVWIGAAAVTLAVGGYVWWQAKERANAKPTYVTEALQRGDLTLTVAANGTLQPTRTVNIGSELSGTVRRVWVDVNDKVTKGQVLVELDTDKLRAQLGRSQATLESAQARLGQAQATLKEAQANLARQQEVHRLSAGKVPSATEMDSAQATLDRAQADVQAGKASVDDARAALVTNQTDLSKAAIKSPIDGVILTRAVDPGNAVAASLQAVTLFTVAEDLQQLRLEVAVDEADVGTVAEGQRASFTVSAYPSRRYPAKVTRVDFGSTKTDNVVTYVARLAVKNEDLSLRPGMTASATIRATERKDVLLVPNAALRFTPMGIGGQETPGNASSTSKTGSAGGSGLVGAMMPMPPRRNRNPGGAETRGGPAQAIGQKRTVWILQGTPGAEQPQAIEVKTGLSDGRMTEVESDTLKEGDLLITDQRTAGAAR